MGRTSVVVSLALGVAGAAPAPGVERAFQNFVRTYGRHYASAAEEQKRFRVFEKNYAFIEAENAKGKSYELGVNEFVDQTPQEFQAGRLGLALPSNGTLWGLPHLGTDEYSGKPLLNELDWSQRGAVTAPKNQAQCGSCWAFSTTGALEGAWKIATGRLMSLSEQQFVDCAKSAGNGCSGGSMPAAFDWAEKHAICSESSYPYTARDGRCVQQSCTDSIPAGAVLGYKDVRHNDERALMEAVSKQPVSVAIEADQAAFQLYTRGILTKRCGDSLDHGVLLVGFGTENGVDYWKVKNSWGVGWGEGGYVRFERGMGQAGECGINSMASYPVVSGEPGPSPGPGPSPAPTPAPGPSPDPGCADREGFCTNDQVFDPAQDCEFLSRYCKQTCGCCDANPPSYCGYDSSASIVV